MAKLSKALFSFSARGSLGKILSFRRKGSQTIVSKIPIVPDAKSLAQLSWRHMYQKAVALWHLLSAEEKAEWESNARPRHMTGFAWFMSQCLKPNPGIYLPLQGGTMQGDIDMATHKIADLPQPTLDQHAATKKYVDDAPPPEHGADKHTDVTRELFIPAYWARLAGCIQANKGEYIAIRFTDAQDQNLLLIMRVPDDFVSFVSLKVRWLTDVAAGNMYWRTHATYAAAGEAYFTHSDTPGYGATSNLGANLFHVQEPVNPLTLPNLAKGDVIALRFQRDATYVSDTINSWVWVMGLLFTYVADQ